MESMGSVDSMHSTDIVLVECKKHCFRLQKHQERLFSCKKKSPRYGCTTQKTELGMQQQVVYHNPNIQISNLEVPVGMVDGILTKLRNPVNQDLWLTDRFSTSVNHPLFLTLPSVRNLQRWTQANKRSEASYSESLCGGLCFSDLDADLRAAPRVKFTGCRLCRRRSKPDDWMF